MNMGAKRNVSKKNKLNIWKILFKIAVKLGVEKIIINYWKKNHKNLDDFHVEVAFKVS